MLQCTYYALGLVCQGYLYCLESAHMGGKLKLHDFPERRIAISAAYLYEPSKVTGGNRTLSRIHLALFHSTACAPWHRCSVVNRQKPATGNVLHIAYRVVNVRMQCTRHDYTILCGKPRDWTLASFCCETLFFSQRPPRSPRASSENFAFFAPLREIFDVLQQELASGTETAKLTFQWQKFKHFANTNYMSNLYGEITIELSVENVTMNVALNTCCIEYDVARDTWIDRHHY